MPQFPSTWQGPNPNLESNMKPVTVGYSDILKDPKYTSSSQYIHYEGIVPEQCVYASFRFILLEDVVYFL